LNRPTFAFLLLIALALGVSAVGCPCISGPVNSSEGLRWFLFSNFGASEMCPELLKRGVPIKVEAMGAYSVGRFFPQTCNVQVYDSTHTVVMTTTGTGYAYLPVTRRVGFYAGLSVEFRPDFYLDDSNDAIYVWGKFNRLMAPPDLRLQGVENAVVNLATQTPLGNVAALLGQGIITSEIARGFTVVQTDDGKDFTLGILSPPARPKRHFKAGKGHVVMATDFTEVQAGSREFIGPITVEESGLALFFKVRVQNAGLSYYLVDRATGDLWRQPYEHAAPIGPPPGPPISYGVIPVGPDQQLPFPVKQGAYYLVVENQSQPAQALGVPLPFQAPPGYATYSVELGDRP
jgi:hypothetical protein